ncbi:MAG: hypothetical protein CSB13_06000 [Chloroflexi bacterium]|nr:MAG: hypothetical protein CSB13_06000 [Chloroflexota bacterium]
MISKAPPLPKYYQLAQILSEQITSGELKPDEQLATEEELCQTYQMSRGTVREAIRLLVDEGLIWRGRGQGTFVKAPTQSTSLFSLTPFNEMMRRQNRVPQTEVLVQTAVTPPPHIAHTLHLNPADPVIHIVCLRLADNHPVLHETRYLAHSLCPALLDEDLATHSIHALLVNKHQIPMVKMSHTVEVIQLTAEQADLLQAKPGTNAFFIERLTTTEKDGVRFPAVWYTGIYLENHYDFRAQLERPSL